MDASPEFQKPNRLRRWLKRLAWLSLTLGILFVLAIVIENWTGARAWKAYVKQLEAKGGSLDPGPPAIPDEQNFAAHPFIKKLIGKDPSTEHFLLLHNRFWRPASDGWRSGMVVDLERWCERYLENASLPKWKEHYRQVVDQNKEQSSAEEILAVLGLFDPELKELREASQRPGCSFPVDEKQLGIISTLGSFHLAALALPNVMPIRSCAELDAAFEDAVFSLHLAHVMTDQSYLILMTARMDMINSVIQVIWEGIHKRQWSDSQLARFELMLSEVNFAGDHQRWVRGETNFTLQLIDGAKTRHEGIEGMRMGFDLSKKHGPMTLPLIQWMQRRLPDGWYDHNKVSVGERGAQLVSFANPDTKQFNIQLVDAFDKDLESKFQRGRPFQFLFWKFDYRSDFSLYWRHDVLGLLALPNYPRMVMMFGAAQAGVNLARIAIALERHRLIHQEHPETLATLDSSVIPKGGMPTDVTDGSAVHYKPAASDRYLLYFNGWDQTNDGGVNFTTNWTNPTASKMDWVWPMPVE